MSVNGMCVQLKVKGCIYLYMWKMEGMCSKEMCVCVVKRRSVDFKREVPREEMGKVRVCAL